MSIKSDSNAILKITDLKSDKFIKENALTFSFPPELQWTPLNIATSDQAKMFF